MIYEMLRELSGLSMRRWLTEEVFSFGWFLMAAILIIVYIIWLRLLDKKRATALLLIGSLAAVAYSLNSMVLGGVFGLADYLVRILPFYSNVFVSSITLSPITIMLAEQYASSWKGYMLRTAIGLAVLCFAVFPLYILVGILEFHNWNVFFHFVVLFVISLVIRLAFLWITGTEKRHA